MRFFTMTLCVALVSSAYGLRHRQVDDIAAIVFFEHLSCFCRALSAHESLDALYEGLALQCEGLSEPIKSPAEYALVIARKMCAPEFTLQQHDQALNLLCNAMSQADEYIAQSRRNKFLTIFNGLVIQIKDHEKRRVAREVFELMRSLKTNTRDARRVRPYASAY